MGAGVLAEYGIMMFLPAGAAVAVWAVVAGLRRRWEPLRALTVAGASVAFTALAPAGCGQLHSNPPHTSCSSISGVEFGYWPAPNSFWHNGHEVLTAQAVLLGYALGAAAVVLAVAWLVREAGQGRRRHGTTSATAP